MSGRKSRALRKQQNLARLAELRPFCYEQYLSSEKEESLCQVHRTGKISVKVISVITELIRAMRQNATDALYVPLENIRDVNSVENAGMRMYMIGVGESAKQIDHIHCDVLDVIASYVPWREIIGARDVLAHIVKRSTIDTDSLVERVISYSPLVKGLPKIICYAQPASKAGVASRPRDWDLVLEAGHPAVHILHLGFLKDGTCFSAVMMYPTKDIGVYHRDTSKRIDTGIVEFRTSDGVKPVTVEPDDANEPDFGYVIVRDTPKVLR